jgi:hypothetical protein
MPVTVPTVRPLTSEKLKPLPTPLSDTASVSTLFVPLKVAVSPATPRPASGVVTPIVPSKATAPPVPPPPPVSRASTISVPAPFTVEPDPLKVTLPALPPAVWSVSIVTVPAVSDTGPVMVTFPPSVRMSPSSERTFVAEPVL